MSILSPIRACSQRELREPRCSVFMPGKTHSADFGCSLLDYFPDGGLACIASLGRRDEVRLLGPAGSGETYQLEIPQMVEHLIVRDSESVVLSTGSQILDWQPDGTLEVVAEEMWNVFPLGRDIFFADCDEPAGKQGSCYFRAVTSRNGVVTLWSGDDEIVVDLARNDMGDLALVMASTLGTSERLLVLERSTGDVEERWSSEPPDTAVPAY